MVADSATSRIEFFLYGHIYLERGTKLTFMVFADGAKRFAPQFLIKNVL